MHTSAPDPWNVNDHRWEPPTAPPNGTLTTKPVNDDEILVYEAGVGNPAPWIRTAEWYSLDVWQ